MRSLRTTVALIVAFSVTLSVVGVALVVWFLARYVLLASVDASLSSRLEAGIFLDGEDGSAPILRPPVSGQPSVLVDAVLADGEVLGVDSETFGLPATAEDVRIAESTPGTRALSTRVAPGGAPVRVLTVNVVDGVAGRAMRSLEETNAVLVRLGTALAVVSVAALATGVGLGIAAVRRSTKPLQDVAQAMQSLSRGEAVEDLASGKGTPREIAEVVAATSALQESLARSQEQQQQLVEDAGHELRTPLAALRANVQFAAVTATDETTQASLEAAQTELDELGHLVEDLLLLAARDERVREVVNVDVCEAIDVAIERVMQRTQREITRHCPEHPVVIRVDPVGLAVILGNLLDNAAKHSPPGTPIVVAVAETLDRVEIQVRDGGPGVPASQREAVFGRFHRAPAARGVPGSGLGLAIVASAVDDAGGSITLGEAPEGGLLVEVSLPRVAPLP